MKTISEQLVINGEEIADELQICLDDNANVEEPIVDEIEKEVQEAIDNAVEIVNDINEAEVQPVKFTDGEGNKAVVEHVKSSAKLRLDEAADDEELVPLDNFIAFFKYGAHLTGAAKRIFENIN